MKVDKINNLKSPTVDSVCVVGIYFVGASVFDKKLQSKQR